MIIRGIELLNNLFYKMKYLMNANVKLALFRVPIFTQMEFDRKSNVCIEKIGINKNVSIRVREDSTLLIKEGVSINNGTIITCRDSITIGKNVLIGPNVMIFDHDHDYRSQNIKDNFLTNSIAIEDNVWIGANSVILKGTCIGKNSIIAAGSIVRGTIPENVVVYDKRNMKMKNIV